MSLDELQEYYHSQIRPDLSQEIPPDKRPSYQDLLAVGHGGLRRAVRVYHDMTLAEFLDRVHGDRKGPETAGWATTDAQTLDALESFMDRQYRVHAETTADSRKHRLRTLVRLYCEVADDDRMVPRVLDREHAPAEQDRVERVLDQIDDRCTDNESKRKYLVTLRQFYRYVEQRYQSEFNPADNPVHDDLWDVPDRDNPRLDADQVRSIFDEATSAEEQLVVVALCGWGLRRGEVAALHASQLDLTGDDPTIAFDTRKNGPGTVSMLYGRTIVESRIDELTDQEGDWFGYLFPSGHSDRDHVTGATINNRFQALAESAGVTVGSATPTTKFARRFWYSEYADAVDNLLDQLDPIASDQGSSDAGVVAENYLSEDDRRRHRRSIMRDRLSSVFES